MEINTIMDTETIAPEAPPKTKTKTKAKWGAYRKPTDEEKQQAEQLYGHYRLWLAEDCADEMNAVGIRDFTARHWAKHGNGPTWREVSEQLRPELWDTPLNVARRWAVQQFYVVPLMCHLRAGGWVRWKSGDPARSLKPARSPQERQKPVGPSVPTGKPVKSGSGKAGPPAVAQFSAGSKGGA